MKEMVSRGRRRSRSWPREQRSGERWRATRTQGTGVDPAEQLGVFLEAVGHIKAFDAPGIR